MNTPHFADVVYAKAHSATDLLSSAIAALKVDSSAIWMFEIAGAWGVNFEYPYGFSWTVMEGSVWMQLNGKSIARFNVGDTFIFPRGTCGDVYTLLTSPQAVPKNANELWSQQQLPTFKPGLNIGRPRRVRWGEGERVDTRIISTAFGFNDRRLGPLIESLPSLMTVNATDVDTKLFDILLSFPFDTAAEAQPGDLAIAVHSVQLFLMHAVRAFALSSNGQKQGWLGALADPRISKALALIHAAPASPLNLEGLARHVGMSRSLFASRFMACVGTSPKQYLNAWRMHLAREALASGSTTVSALAENLGYQSESAFRTAFRKFDGRSPREYKRDAKTADG